MHLSLSHDGPVAVAVVVADVKAPRAGDDPGRHAGGDGGDRRRRARAGRRPHRAGRCGRRPRCARRMLGGTYGRVVNVIAGKGNNGADGRVAGRPARRRRGHGARVRGRDCPAALPPADLVIDAAYGTGFHGDWRAPSAARPWCWPSTSRAASTGSPASPRPACSPPTGPVTFAALKPGLLSRHDGKRLAGEVEVADIGLDVTSARAHVVGRRRRRRGGDRVRRRPQVVAAVRVVAGQPGDDGAASLGAAGGDAAGAGMVWLSIPGRGPPPTSSRWSRRSTGRRRGARRPGPLRRARRRARSRSPRATADVGAQVRSSPRRARSSSTATGCGVRTSSDGTVLLRRCGVRDRPDAARRRVRRCSPAHRPGDDRLGAARRPRRPTRAPSCC